MHCRRRAFNFTSIYAERRFIQLCEGSRNWKREQRRGASMVRVCHNTTVMDHSYYSPSMCLQTGLKIWWDILLPINTNQFAGGGTYMETAQKQWNVYVQSEQSEKRSQPQTACLVSVLLVQGRWCCYGDKTLLPCGLIYLSYNCFRCSLFTSNTINSERRKKNMSRSQYDLVVLIMKAGSAVLQATRCVLGRN